jgi:hypothetical protein
MPREQRPRMPDVGPGAPDDNADPEARGRDDNDCVAGWMLVHDDWNARAGSAPSCAPPRTRWFTKLVASVRRLWARGDD